MLAYKLLRVDHVAIAILAVLCHLFVCALVLRIVALPGALHRRVLRDKLAAFVLGVWLIGTWIVGLRL